MLMDDVLNWLDSQSGIKISMDLPWIVPFNLGDYKVDYIVYQLQGFYGIDAVVDRNGIIENLHRKYLPIYDRGSIKIKTDYTPKKERVILAHDNYYKHIQHRMKRNGQEVQDVVEVRCQFSEAYNEFGLFVNGLTKLFHVRNKSVSQIEIIQDQELVDLILSLN